MRLKTGYVLVELIDNTQTDFEEQTGISKAILHGVTDSHMLISPNYGKIIKLSDTTISSLKNGDFVHFYTFSMQYLEGTGCVILHEDDVVLNNGELIKPGVLFQKQKISQTVDIFGTPVEFKSFELDRVCQSTIDDLGICVDDLIISRPFAFYRIYVHGEEYFFCSFDNILLHLSTDRGIQTGPVFQLVSCIPIESCGIKTPLKKKNMAIDTQGNTLIFKRFVHELTISGVDYYIIKKEDILGYD